MIRLTPKQFEVLVAMRDGEEMTVTRWGHYRYSVGGVKWVMPKTVEQLSKHKLIRYVHSGRHYEITDKGREVVDGMVNGEANTRTD